MNLDFTRIKGAVSSHFAKMTQSRLYQVDVSGDELWDTYLSSFPEGTNPIYRTRTEHNCSCCRQFIRNIGNVVTIEGGRVISIWDVDTGDENYNVVVNALSKKVHAAQISNVYLHYEESVGTKRTFEALVDGQKAWDHFYAALPSSATHPKASIAEKLGQHRTSFELLKRAIETISDDAVAEVQDLIAQNSIYRGAEHAWVVEGFRLLKRRYVDLKINLDLFLWKEVGLGLHQSIIGIRNSVIGTLLVDLSEGVPLDRAVASFESKVAPANYKRPTALVTKAMIASAKTKIEELGLTSALERRYATIDDISINDVLFANGQARRTITKDVFDNLAATVPVKQKKLDKVEEVPIEKFISDILPTVTSMEVLVENRHAGNFVSLVAPVEPTAPGMFKWGNAFSWSYTGDMADSIKERVKQAGGNVTGELCCRLAWDYTDDLDFHMYEPAAGKIYYANRGRKSRNGGILDVDANGCDGIVPNPVENIVYEKLSTMAPGSYELKVHNYNRRSAGVGFEVEIDLLGEVWHLAYDKVVTQGQLISAATITKDGQKVTVTPHLDSTQKSKQVWGVTTGTFVPVTVMLLSPNHWESSGSGVGNKHYFFMLEGCLNEGVARGFFNEYLKSELEPHRKVIEMVGAKLKTEKSDRQLSGLGFSSTSRNKLTCRVTSSFTRNITITF